MTPRSREKYLAKIILIFSLSLSANLYAKENFSIIETALSTSVESKTITSLAAGTHGELYLATQEGLYLFDGRELKPAIDYSNSLRLVGESSISKALVSSKGAVWFSSNTHGMHYITPQNGVVTSPSGLSGLRGRIIRNLAFDQNGYLWITDESNVWKYDVLKDRLLPVVFHDETELGRIRSNALIVDSNGDVWLCSDTGLWTARAGEKPLTKVLDIGLATINIGRGKEIIAFSNAGSLLRFSADTHIILSQSLDLEQEYLSATGVVLFENNYILSSDEGIFIFDSTLRNIDRLTTENSLLSNDHVTELSVIDNSLYIATFRGISGAVSTAVRWFDQQNSSINNEVLSISEGKDNRIWIGTYGGVYSRASNSAEHSQLQNRNQILSTEEIRAMEVSVINGYAFIGTWESGLIQTKLNGSNTPTSQIAESRILQSGSITKIFHSDDGAIWVGRYDGKLYRYHLENGNVSKNEAAPVLVLDAPVLNIAEVSAHKLLVATEKTLYWITKDSGDLIEINFELDDSAIRPAILSIYISNENELWLGTLNEGIYKSRPIDFDKQSTVSFSKVIHPEENHTFYAIESPGNDDIWASSNSGIVVFNQRANYENTLGKRDGLKSLDFNQGASLIDSQGNLYFGGSNGYAVFNPADMDFERKPSPMLLTGLDIAGDTSTPATALPYLSNIEISYRDRFITFMFNVIDYFDSSQNRYRYMLEGFDPGWVEAGDRDSATFTNLPAGRYVFRAQGSNSDGVWNREGIRINLVVHAAPWRTWWAYALYFLLLAGLIWSLKKTYDTYMLKEKATAIAEDMNRAVEDAMDDIQEQLENQDTLVRRFHQRNLDTLGLISHLQEPDWPRRQNGSIPALEALESTLSYQGDQLLFDLQACINLIVAKVLAANPAQAESINTILDVPNVFLPASLGSYLAIALFEIADDTVANLPAESGLGNYIQVAISMTEDSSINLTVQSSYSADPRDDTAPPLTTRKAHRLVHLERLLKTIGASLEVDENQYDRVVAIIPQTAFSSQAHSPE